MNYIGQLRLYSLVDFIAMLLAFGFEGRELVGATCLWLSFLCLLEQTHRHEGRLGLSVGLAGGFAVAGILYWDSFGNNLFLLWSLLYCFKNRKPWGLVSPFLRGFQTASLLWGHGSGALIILASIAIVVRNILGDARDTSKDRASSMLTWPVLFHWADHRFVHLFAVMATSAIWCAIGGFSPLWLIGLWIIQWMTYWVTPR